jgi:hypothetical protein
LSFSYLIDKIRAANFEQAPFRHVQINDFFNESDFRAITGAPELAIGDLGSDTELFDALFSNGYKIIDFPGCIVNKDEYIRWHQTKRTVQKTNTACEGFGITLRLMGTRTPIVADLVAFLNGAEFQAALAEKFEIPQSDTFYDCGLQKYLDGYEISPHPDIRKKALTYMVNVNPGVKSEDREHHTHYLNFREAYKYIGTYWDGNPTKDRCWVPWDWCETKKMQRENNSIVVFSPSNDTIHGVKTQYDHLSGQRTQLYGNFWYHDVEIDSSPQWEDLAIGYKTDIAKTISLKALTKAVLPKRARELINGVRNSGANVIADRLSGPRDQ